MYMKKTIYLCASILLCLAIILVVCIVASNGKKNSDTQIVKSFELMDGNITAENVSPAEGVYTMTFTNTGDKTIQKAQIVFGDGTQELMFQFEMLPVGQTITVVELDEIAVVAEELKYIDSSISYLEDGLEDTESVKVTGNGKGMIEVKNITDEVLPLVRVFYRQTDKKGNMIGGPCYSALVDGIAPGETAQVEADHWDNSCVVVTVLIINQ